MIPVLPEKLRLKLLKALGAKPASEAAEDELTSVLLQISLAIMLIFMIAFFVFMNKVGTEISQIDKMEVQLSTARKDKIVHAVTVVAERYRVRYGLPFFLRFDPETGSKNYDLSSVVQPDGTMTADAHALRSFQTGGKNAFADYADSSALETAWKREVLTQSGFSLEGLNPSERRFLSEQVDRQIGILKSEVMEVQTLAAASLQEHLARNPRLVHDAAIRSLLEKLKNPAPGSERDLWLAELSSQLKKYVYEELRKISGVPMLVSLQ